MSAITVLTFWTRHLVEFKFIKIKLKGQTVGISIQENLIAWFCLFAFSSKYWVRWLHASEDFSNENVYTYKSEYKI